MPNHEKPRFTTANCEKVFGENRPDNIEDQLNETARNEQAYCNYISEKAHLESSLRKDENCQNEHKL